MKPVACIVDDELYFADEIDWEELQGIPLYTAPTIVKDEQGKVVAVTLTNEEHQVQEVLWQAPKELSRNEITEVIAEFAIKSLTNNLDYYDFAEAILKKASEK